MLTPRLGHINYVKAAEIVAGMCGGLGDFNTDRQTDRQVVIKAKERDA